MNRHKLHVVTMVSNPVRFVSRYRLYREFAERMKLAGVELWTVELAFGHRHFAVTEPCNPRHLQLRTKTEIWHKENALNLLIQRLPDDWEYVCWIDADVEPATQVGMARWIDETYHQLQHYQVVQMFQQAVDLGPHGETIQVHTGFAYSYVKGLPAKPGYTSWHPGYAWGMRREAFEAVGGLINGPLGSGDRHMACGLIGKAGDTLNAKLTPGYKAMVLNWQEQAERHVRRSIGYVPGTILHHWHGKKVDRRYVDRWKILIDEKFDPFTDLKHDYQGLIQLCDHGDARSARLRDKIMAYFRGRREDSTDLE